MSELIVDIPEGWYPTRRKGEDYEYIFSSERIVRCRDCKWSRIADGSSWPANKHKEYVGKTYCIIWGDECCGEWVEPDGFCWKGESAING